uniref:Retrovirus-related Pol polyprotein from transposon TNT 1-94 n=1 Tax=Tanacetum cinerariifolium TaxID=118510 RepID=A0A6L2KP70_TANCI|nr:hypothetical protein [Tanacetum cinerariifolium]
MLLYIKGKEHGKSLVDLVLNEPFQYRTIIKPGNETIPATVRARTYTDLTNDEKIRESVDIKETNIILQGLPQNIYNLVNHNEHAKQIWDRVKLLIQGETNSSGETDTGYAYNRARNTATNQGVNRKGAIGQPRVVKCYNYPAEGHFTRQCTKPKRPKNLAWFKEKMLLTEALESRAYLDPEQLAFLADNGDTVTLI